jgi:alpha-beta hydrolase superfamily lysophospholipase
VAGLLYAREVATASIQARDGISLNVADHELDEPRARIVIVHGYAEHLGRYDELVGRLAARGFECHLFDLRGHGHSGGVPAHVARFDDYIDDLGRVLEHVRDRAASHDDATSPRPLLLLGHSLGGLIALAFVRAQPAVFEALAVTSPFLRPGFEVPAVKRMLASVASVILPTLPFSNTLDPLWLSNDAGVVAAYASDPLVQRTTTPRWFTEVQEAQQQLLANAAEVTIPLLMMLGDEDQIADHKLSTEMFARLGSADKTLRTFPGLRHEILNETSRDVVIEELLGWLERHV